MAVFRNETFSNETIILDGNQYTGCKFNGCRLLFNGGDLPVMQSCELNDSPFQFGGAADRTLTLMASIHQGMGPGGKQLIENTFTAIRDAGAR